MCRDAGRSEVSPGGKGRASQASQDAPKAHVHQKEEEADGAGNEEA
jgi:hypothetical protein